MSNQPSQAEGAMPTAVILAGGKGTRLLPFTITFPKPLVPIGDMPILEILLRQLHASGVRNVVLTLDHLAELIRAFIGQRVSGELAELAITYVEESQPTGTAGSLASVPGLDRTFLVMNGDLLTNLDFRELARHHKASGAELTIAGHVNRVKIDLGVLELDEAGRLIGYQEKPEEEYLGSMGVYVYEPSVLDLIPKGEYLDFPTLVLKLLEQGRNVSVYPFDGLWLDIGRPDDYARAQEIYESNREMFVCPRDARGPVPMPLAERRQP
jgi:NDP-sugar pyrophosphorylase family protein